MTLSAQTPTDRAGQLLALTRRLTERLISDSECLEARRPQEIFETLEETRSLSNLYRFETARIKADPSLLSGITPAEKQALFDATKDFHENLARYELAVNAAKTITEGIITAVAEDLNTSKVRTATYGAHGRPQSGGAQSLNLGRNA